MTGFEKTNRPFTEKFSECALIRCCATSLRRLRRRPVKHERTQQGRGKILSWGLVGSGSNFCSLFRARTSAACCDPQLFDILITQQPYTSRVSVGSKLYDGIDKNSVIEWRLAMGMDSPLKPFPHQNFEGRFEGNSNNRSIVHLENFPSARLHKLCLNALLLRNPTFSNLGKTCTCRGKICSRMKAVG